MRAIPLWTTIAIGAGLFLFAAGWATREFGSAGKQNDTRSLQIAGTLLFAYSSGWLHGAGHWKRARRP